MSRRDRALLYIGTVIIGFAFLVVASWAMQTFVGVNGCPPGQYRVNTSGPIGDIPGYDPTKPICWPDGTVNRGLP